MISVVPKRWVICFHDWPEEKAKKYTECWRIVEERVKPERATNNRKARREKWWMFGDYASGLQRSISGLSFVQARSQVSKTQLSLMWPTNWIFDQRLIVFSTDCRGFLACLNSSLHYWWALQYGATLRTDATYTPTTCFETFPLPDWDIYCRSVTNASLVSAGQQWEEAVNYSRFELSFGLTQLFNDVHDDTARNILVGNLRQLQSDLDRAVAAAYGWDDLDLGHGFHETRQGTRFTISEPARREVLARLLKLNHERHAEEVAQGLHDKKRGKTKTPASGRGRGRKASSGPTMFD